MQICKISKELQVDLTPIFSVEAHLDNGEGRGGGGGHYMVDCAGFESQDDPRLVLDGLVLHRHQNRTLCVVPSSQIYVLLE